MVKFCASLVLCVQVFEFNYWFDDSDETVTGLEDCLIVRIKLKQNVEPGDGETKEEMRRRSEAIQQRNRYTGSGSMGREGGWRHRRECEYAGWREEKRDTEEECVSCRG